MKIEIEIELSPNVTIGDVRTAQGAIFHASTEFVDWEALHDGAMDAISAPGRICLDIARQLERRVGRG